MPEYTELIPDDTTSSAIELAAYDFIQNEVSEWDPADGDPTVWIIKTFSGVISQLFEVVADVSDEIFAAFGENLMGIERRQARAAEALSTWTVIGGPDYEIPSGQAVLIPAGDETRLFLTASDVSVPAGDSSVKVPLIAEEPGTESNNLGADPILVDALGFVEQIVLDAPTTGGADEETMDEYLPRLREMLQLMSPRPIIPEHFEVLARQDQEVFRAVAIPGLDPETHTYDNALTMTVAVMKENGLPLTGAGMDRVKAALEQNVPINSVVNVVEPDYTGIKVEVEIVSLPEYDHETVKGAVERQLDDYLQPMNWGRREGWGMVPTKWVNSDTVRFYEIVEVVNRAVGVDYIVNLEIGTGSSMGTVDVELDGDVPLTVPLEITVS